MLRFWLFCMIKNYILQQRFHGLSVGIEMLGDLDAGAATVVIQAAVRSGFIGI